MTSFGVKADQRQEERKSNWHDEAWGVDWVKGTERGGTTRAHLVATVLYAQETFQQENGRTELGEELLNLQAESMLFELKAFVNHDLCKSDAGFLVMDNFFICFPIGETSGLLWEEEVGGFGLTIGNQIIFVELRSFNMKDGTVDFGHPKSILFAQSFCLSTMHLSKELFDMGKLLGKWGSLLLPPELKTFNWFLHDCHGHCFLWLTHICPCHGRKNVDTINKIVSGALLI